MANISSLIFAKADEFRYAKDFLEVYANMGNGAAISTCLEGVVLAGIIGSVVAINDFQKSSVVNSNKINTYDLHEWKMKVK